MCAGSGCEGHVCWWLGGRVHVCWGVGGRVHVCWWLSVRVHVCWGGYEGACVLVIGWESAFQCHSVS